MIFRNLFIFLIANILLVGAANAQVSTCTLSGSAVVHPGVGNVCWTQPDTYETTVYEIALCTSAPTAPTSSSVLGSSNCTTIFSNSGGATIQISGGSGTAPSGIFTRPPNDTYTHGYVIVDKDFTVESNIEFTTSVTADGGGSGVYCATQTGSPSSPPTMECAGSAPTAGTLSVTTDSLGGGGFSASTTASFTGSSGSTVNMNAYLIDSSSNLATSSGVVDRILAVQSFASPVTITAASTSFTFAVNTSNGMTVIDTAGTTALDNGPFRVDLTVF